jgi:DNA polymerase elongation subunit (family B)
MEIIDKWKKEMAQVLLTQFPEKDQNDINTFLERIIKKRLNNQPCVVSNDYLNKNKTLGLVDFANWALEKSNPILTGFGVCYKQHEKTKNLVAEMLNYLLSERKKAKKEMFLHINDEDKTTMKNLDRIQKIFKLLANSYYGVSGERNSYFFDKRVGPSITYTGQQIITTAVVMFEAFLANNTPFNNISEILLFIERVKNEKREYDYKDVIGDFKLSHEDLIKYLDGKTVKNLSKDNLTLLHNAIKNLSEEDLIRLYFKNNLYSFLTLEPVMGCLAGTISDSFSNVENPPEEIKEYLEAIWDMIREFVVYKWVPEDRYKRVVEDARKAVLVVDTDSNFINIDPFCKFMSDNFGLDLEDNNTRLSTVNIMIYIINKFTNLIFADLTKSMNVPEDKRKNINMKNEFMYSRLMLTKNKKQYVGRIVAQEGKILNPTKVDIKGLSIKKVSVNRFSRDYFQDIIDNVVLSNKEINIGKILKKFKEYENLIRESIINKEIRFSVPLKFNEIQSYKAPLTIQAVRGSIIWNELYPDNMIVPPDKVNSFKLKVETLDDLRPIFKTREFDILRKIVFEDEQMAHYGLKIICFPKSVTQIPDWLVQFIDIDKIVDDNVRNGIIILESLGVKTIKIKDQLFYSNLVDF